jgi:hypothetical protein
MEPRSRARSRRKAYDSLVDKDRIERASWTDFLDRAKTANQQFLEAHRTAGNHSPE